MFPNKWIERGGPVPWPARSPDLTPLDFYLWGQLKTLVYTGGEITDRAVLVNKINNAFEMIKNDDIVLSRVREQLRFRVGVCIGCDGDHFERFVRDRHQNNRRVN